MSIPSASQFCQLGLAVIQTEAKAIATLQDRINENFARACQYLLECKGRIVVLGMGKSGHIGSKIAATLASTGSPAFFVHPGEASHGDLGMITRHDCVLALSNSGETVELLQLLPMLKWLSVPLITLTGKANSTLAQAATVNIDVSVTQEACPLGLSPTSSTTAALVMGDALAIALLQARGFTAADFARAHPSGTLGLRLLLRIDDLMHTGDTLPCVSENATLRDALLEMTQKKLGMTTIRDDQHRLQGIFTDGDLRRAFEHNINLNTTLIKDIMTRQCKTIRPGTMAVEALQYMENFKITSLVVTQEDNTIIGVIHMHDILRAGLAC